MNPTIKICKVAEVNIYVHYSWFLILGLLTWILSHQVFSSIYNWSPFVYWSIAFICSILLFLSILIHELAHCLVAKTRGLHAKGITLFLLGGMSEMEVDPAGPIDELMISAVGPATSLLLSIIFGLLLVAYPPGDAPWKAVIAYLAVANLSVALFNLLPALPLDGGRILRSSLWALTGSELKSTLIAARAGQCVGLILVSLAVHQLFHHNIAGGLWVLLMGGVLFRVASTTYAKPHSKGTVTSNSMPNINKKI